MPKLDWLWVIIGVAIGLVIHQSLCHPKSPIYMGTSFFNMT